MNYLQIFKYSTKTYVYEHILVGYTYNKLIHNRIIQLVFHAFFCIIRNLDNIHLNIFINILYIRPRL